MIKKASTSYLMRYAVPLFIRDEKKKNFQVVATAIPLKVKDKHFLVTAAHVVLENNKLFFPVDYKLNKYPTLFNDLKIKKKTNTIPRNSKYDKFDFAFLEIEEDSLSDDFSNIPLYMIEKLLHLDHIKTIALLGYPITKNQSKYKSKHQKLYPLACDLEQMPIEEYRKYGLNPLFHFCVKYNPKKMKNEDGQDIVPPYLNGMSGGPAWHLTETSIKQGNDENATLIGITINNPEKFRKKIVWGIRISYIVAHIVKQYPELESYFSMPKIRIVNEKDLKIWSLISKQL